MNIEKHFVIIIPTLEEAKRILPDAPQPEPWLYGVSRGEVRGIPYFVSGIGKANAAIAATLICMQERPAEVLVAGICGAYRESGCAVGDVVSIQNDFFVDDSLCLTDTLTMVSEMGFPVCDNNQVRYNPVVGIPVVSGNTVSMISGTDQLARLYSKKTGAAVESMEGAAFGLAFQRFGVKAYQVRSVSNFCGERSRQEWDIKKAVRNISEYLTHLFSVKKP